MLSCVTRTANMLEVNVCFICETATYILVSILQKQVEIPDYFFFNWFLKLIVKDNKQTLCRFRSKNPWQGAMSMLQNSSFP